MYDNASASDIIRFLNNAKTLIQSGHFTFIPRKKCMQSLARHGLTISEAKDHLLTLTTENYYKGPKPDKDPDKPGNIWEFKKIINQVTFYIKLKIDSNGHLESELKCLGFHEDEY